MFKHYEKTHTRLFKTLHTFNMGTISFQHAMLKWNPGPSLVCCSMSTSPYVIPTSVLYFTSLMLATRVWYRQSFMYPHRKKPEGAISSDLASQETGPAQPILWFGKWRLICARNQTPVHCTVLQKEHSGLQVLYLWVDKFYSIFR
jgi:hypothetical protein